MECAANGTFGPVVSIYPVADVEDAVEKANDSPYGLNANVWAHSAAEGEQIAARLRSGTVNVNEGYAFACGSLSAPMGGMGQSGVGRRHGPEGLLKYTESQTIASARLFNFDAPLGIPNSVWQKSLVPVVRTVMRLPGRN
jgi:succinate-semialdehyde dehydrogenase / glutarate-semialdehyde dehydrogenase